MTSKQSYPTKLRRAWNWPFKFLRRYWRQNLWHKIVVIAVCIFLLCLGTMYGIARWYIWQEGNQPVTYGVSFIPDYAAYLGVNPQATMDALITDLHVREFRLTSYWSDIETSPGHYDFSQLDWEFAKADAAHAKVILTVGLRQPRWPECHAPSFYNVNGPQSQWYPQLKAYMTAVINRYKNNPALQAWQVENEYFLKGFGNCTNMSRSRLVDETNLVRRLDPHHEVIIARSNNALGWPVGAPAPDTFSISIYRRVWDAAFTHRYIEYPFPAWYYAFVAGWQKLFTGKDMIIGELQAEAWPAHGKPIPETSLAEQNKSINAQRLKNVFQFGKATGMKTIILWGSEYWYYRKEVLHDPSLWNVARQAMTANSHGVLFTLSDSGSTNTPAWTLTVNQDGSGSRTVATERNRLLGSANPPAAARASYPAGTFKVGLLAEQLAAYGNITTLGGRGCLKSVSFGTTETLSYDGQKSGDLTCPSADAAGQNLIDAIQATTATATP